MTDAPEETPTASGESVRDALSDSDTESDGEMEATGTNASLMLQVSKCLP